MPSHSWNISRSFVMIEKQWLSCFVSWSDELWPENSMIPARFSSTVLKQKTSLLHDIESIDSLLSHVKSFMGSIKIICDDLGAMA
jgi:hypothetical protein